MVSQPVPSCPACPNCPGCPACDGVSHGTALSGVPWDTNELIVLFCPFPPSANRLWTRTKRGMRKTDKYAEWLHNAGWAVKAQQPGKTDKHYQLTIIASRPDRRRRDLGNLEKAISDLLVTLGVVGDDSDCEKIEIAWAAPSELIAESQDVLVMVQPVEAPS